MTIARSAAEGEFVPARRSVVFALNGVSHKPTSVLVRGKTIPEVPSLAQVTEGWLFDSTLKRLSIKSPDSQEEIDVAVR